MKKTRFIALALIFALFATLFSGCSGKTIMKIDGKSVPEGYYIYYFIIGYQTLSNSGSAFDEQTLAQYASEKLMTYYATEKLAKEYGIELAALDRKAVLDSMNEQIASMGGKSAYKQFLSAMKLSNNQYKQLLYNAYLNTMMREYLYNAETGIDIPTREECKALFAENYCAATHILISTQNYTDQKDFDAAKVKAEEILARAKTGEDFVALANEFNEDPGQDNAIGYVFPEGQMIAAFEDAAFALEPGQISDLVQTKYGYHIIRRNEITDDLYSLYHDSFYENAKAYFLQQRLSEITESMDYTVLDAINDIDMDAALNLILSSANG